MVKVSVFEARPGMILAKPIKEISLEQDIPASTVISRDLSGQHMSCDFKGDIRIEDDVREDVCLTTSGDRDYGRDIQNNHQGRR